MQPVDLVWVSAKDWRLKSRLGVPPTALKARLAHVRRNAAVGRWATVASPQAPQNNNAHALGLKCACCNDTLCPTLHR